MEFNVTSWHLLSLFWSFGPLRCFVANLICRNLRIFSGKILLAHTMLSFCMSGQSQGLLYKHRRKSLIN